MIKNMSFVNGRWVESVEDTVDRYTPSFEDVARQVAISNECKGARTTYIPSVTKDGRLATLVGVSPDCIINGVEPTVTDLILEDQHLSYLAYNWDIGVYELMDAPKEPSIFWQVASTVVGLVLIAVLVYNMVTIV